MVITTVSGPHDIACWSLTAFTDIEYSISPIGNYSSGGAVIEFRDVTEQKKIERERMSAILMTEQQSSV
jgi:hypothetical protein